MTRKGKPASRRKRLGIILLWVGAALVVLLAVSVEVTSSSRFCSVCHYMKPFYKSWQESSHHQVPCSTCHYPPGLRSKLRAKVEGLVMVGRYWTKLYLQSRPWAEISDQSCLKPGCHEKRLLQGKVPFGKIVFDHTVHLTDLRRGKKLRCTSCHSQIVQGKHITVTATTCFLCHFKESPSSPRAINCTGCHPKAALTSTQTSRYDHTSVFQKGFACDKCHTHTIVGDGAVPREQCYKCHFQTAWLEQYGDTDRMHRVHITEHKIECSLCHLEIQHKIVKDIAAIADCQACHTGTHDAQKILFTGQGGKGVAKAEPNVMLDKGLSCKACHIFHEESAGGLLKAGTFTAREKACESCHGPGFARILKEWEDSTARKLSAIREIYARTAEEVRLSRAASGPKERALALLGDASYNIDIVDKGKSVHNIAYSQELLSVAFMRMTQALKVAGSSYQPEGSAFRTGRVPPACASCHTGVEDVSAPVFGVVFSHRTHLNQNLTCQDCHSNTRRHGELTATKASCAGCHHTDAQASCSACHVTQKAFFEGGTVAGLTVPADVMAEAGVDCKACHLNASKAVSRPDGAKCASCHEASYAETLAQWQTETRAAISRLAASAAGLKARGLTDPEKAALDSIARFLDSLAVDGSSGVHNQAFVRSQLAALEKRLQAFARGPEHE